MTDNDVTLTDTDSEVADQVDSSSLEAAVDNALAAGVGGGGTIVKTSTVLFSMPLV